MAGRVYGIAADTGGVKARKTLRNEMMTDTRVSQGNEGLLGLDESRKKSHFHFCISEYSPEYGHSSQ